ncbi:hypothetical protein ACFY3O_27785 [Streptomyces sp. NPDC001046]|uniref:hypothetical protein n=1 Tax=Streptomyces sp. NPDC001046 TaxID=3364543 RepID=UPI003693AE79
MTLTDWLVDIALVLIVFRQLREGRLGPKSYLIPLSLVTFFASQYLRGLPTDGNDLVLVGVLMGAGAALGIAGGVFTRIRSLDGHLMIKAGVVSAVLWVVGMGARLGFQLWVDHGGADDVARFSAEHQITSQQAWVTALLLMAVTEVVTRLATIFVRSRGADRTAQPKPMRGKQPVSGQPG